MNIENMTKPAGVLLGLAAVAAASLAAGYVIARDPKAIRRLTRALAGGVERVSAAVAETREELADLWAEAREDVRAAADDAAFAKGGASTSVESSDAEPGDAADAKPARRKRRRSAARAH
jgi:hypothetical protein